jgi:TPR repeat protein
MNNLGTCYRHGFGVDEDKTKGLELYEQSALLGFSVAMYNLGVCYQYGTAVSRDLNTAKEWYAKAAAQGNEIAQESLDELNAPPDAESDNE